MARKPLITIHGVNSVGLWQDSIDRVLAPHFECLHRKYPDYPAPWGPIRACISLRASILGIASSGLLVWLLSRSLFWSGIVAIPCGFVAGIAYARYRRQKVVDRFVTWHGEITLPLTELPHLIAHSLGTFISGTSLHKQPAVRFDRVILVGAVLPRGFPWKAIENDGPRKFCAVRNEVGQQDWVSVAAGLAPLVTGLGSSGANGFLGEWVHSGVGPWESCTACRTGPPSAVHNVDLGPFGHNDMLLSIKHVFCLWLPVLWGISPGEYDRYNNLCSTAVSLESAGDLRNLAIVEDELMECVWSWTTFADSAALSLEEFLEVTAWEFLERKLRACDATLVDAKKSQIVISIATRACRLIWTAHVKAVEELGAENAVHHTLLALHPRTAAIRAIDALF